MLQSLPSQECVPVALTVRVTRDRPLRGNTVILNLNSNGLRRAMDFLGSLGDWNFSVAFQVSQSWNPGVLPFGHALLQLSGRSGNGANWSGRPIAPVRLALGVSNRQAVPISRFYPLQGRRSTMRRIPIIRIRPDWGCPMESQMGAWLSSPA
jgi:hypothetical protein